MYELYKKRVSSTGSYMGEALKKQSDAIMDATFTRDIAYRKCYINGEPVDAKYIVHAYYTISKDAVDYHIQFRPGVHYPIGTYIDIPDDVGEYHRWLLLNRSDEPQFPKYNALKCNWIFKWIVDGVIHEQLGILRLRNNYNSGLWSDYLTTTPENQTQFIVPTNQNTQTIYYNQRFLISDNHINPIAWEVSKIEDTSPLGITYITLKQDLFNPNTDNKELMLADYYTTPVLPKDEENSSILYNGQAELKVGGSFKSFHYSSDFRDDMKWKIEGIPDNKYNFEESGDTIKIQIINDYELIGSTLTLSVTSNNKVISSLQIGVVSL